ncbi:uncharacterized protein FA14DRAFT_149582 [Meira miltonrushii]|uniref:ARM repeat-containing protein n=1 Tax=Meira miltonrushii TaxID=1280837 RepID=A0A316V769_9BASI|nr:uncharacterized protein FA14DRAFT_149582 [Meira miltonrushii]PWN32858.1 hypothetical protein FA14DRAFT_149582 [Meira miltonrushii]
MVRQSTATASSSSTPGWARLALKGQSADSIQKKLNGLWHTLEKEQPGDVSTEILDNVMSQINQKDLMFHKNKEIRTALALSIAQVLRLYAPESPLEEDQLKLVFDLFLAVLTSPTNGLGKQNGAQFQDCIALLDSLVRMRAFALLCEYCNAEQSMQEYFRKFFDLVHPDLPKNVEISIAEALSLFIQHSTTVPKGVVKQLIASFQPKVKKSNPAASHLAELIGQNAADELQTYIAQYFVEVLEQAVQVTDEQERESDLQACHILIAHVHKMVPKLMYNVLPQLEEEIRAEDPKLRLIAVQTFGQIFAHRALQPGNHQTTLAKMYENPWKVWLTRSWDKNNSVRVAWVSSLVSIIGKDSNMDADVMQSVEQKLLDSDEKVRLAMVKVFLTLEYSVLRSILTRQLYDTLAERVKDKKVNVRIAALQVLGRIFALAYEGIASGDAATIKRFGSIPNDMVSALTAQDGQRMITDIQASFERFILPLPADANLTEWTKRLQIVIQLIDPDLVHCFIQVFNLKAPRKHFFGFIDACKRYNGGVVENSQVDHVRKSMLRWIDVLSTQFPDPLKAGQDLHAFAKQNDARAYKLIAIIMDQGTTIEQYVKVYKELVKRSQSERYAATLIAFVRLAGFPFVNTSSILPILNTLDQDASHLLLPSKQTSYQHCTLQMLKTMSEARTEMFAPHFDQLRATLHEDEVGQRKRVFSMLVLSNAQSHLRDQEPIQFSDSDIESLGDILKTTTDPDCAKFGSKLLALIASNTASSGYETAYRIAEELSEKFGSTLPVNEADSLVCALIILRQITKHARDATAAISDEMTASVLNVLVQEYTPPDSIDESQDWFEPEEMDSSLKTKLLALRFLTAKCIAFADHEDIGEIAAPILRLICFSLLHGEPAKGIYRHSAAHSHIKLEASLQLLKMARHSALERMIGVSDNQQLALMLQSDHFKVRENFIRKLCKYAISKAAHLPPRYYAFMFLVAKDPEDEIKRLVKETCNGLLSVMKPETRLRYFDIALARLIYMINHHPDFENLATAEGDALMYNLEESADYFEFYFYCCLTQDNLACLNYIASRCKGMRDHVEEGERRGVMEEDGPRTIGLHILSDVCTCLIKRRAESMGTIVGDWQGQVGLPKELYTTYISREEQVKVLKKTYLSNEIVEAFSHPIRLARPGQAKRKVSAQIEKQTNRTPKKAKTAKEKVQPRKRRLNDEESSDDEEEEEEDDDPSSEISADEEVETTEDEAEAGRGVRNRRKLRQEKRSRNERRRQKREAKAKK